MRGRIGFRPIGKDRYELTVPIAFDRVVPAAIPELRGLQDMVTSPTGFATLRKPRVSIGFDFDGAVRLAAPGRRVVGAGDADPTRRVPSSPTSMRRAIAAPASSAARRRETSWPRSWPSTISSRGCSRRCPTPSGHARAAIPRSAPCPSSFSPSVSASTPRSTRRRSRRRRASVEGDESGER